MIDILQVPIRKWNSEYKVYETAEIRVATQLSDNKPREYYITPFTLYIDDTFKEYKKPSTKRRFPTLWKAVKWAEEKDCQFVFNISGIEGNIKEIHTNCKKCKTVIKEPKKSEKNPIFIHAYIQGYCTECFKELVKPGNA